MVRHQSFFWRLCPSGDSILLYLQAIRFDNKATKEERLKEDNLAPVRYIFDHFVDKCVQNYSVGEYITIDEMLEAFRGRCRFR